MTPIIRNHLFTVKQPDPDPKPKQLKNDAPLKGTNNEEN